MSDYAPSPGALVRQARRARGWTMEDAARAAGIGTRTLLRFEQGEAVRPTTVVKIARALDLPVAVLMPDAAA